MKRKIKYQLLLLFIISLFSCQHKVEDKKYNIPENTTPETHENIKLEYYPSHQFDHIDHIRRNSKIAKLDGVAQEPNYFIDYVIENLLEKVEYKKFLTDRKLLRKLNNEICWENVVWIRDSLTNGDKIEIDIRSDTFDPKNHQYQYHKETKRLTLIDGMKFHGTIDTKPKTEVELVRIKINERELNISIDKYLNIYEPKFCYFAGYSRITEAYEDGEFIYIYIFGGNAASSYFAKLIFNKNDGYITSIISDYGTLSKYGSFSSKFIGY